MDGAARFGFSRILRTRWTRRVVILLAILGGIWLAANLIRGPQLRPVTRRLLPTDFGLIFSASGQGFPIIQLGPLTRMDREQRWLDDLCAPMPGKALGAGWSNESGLNLMGISALGTYAAWVDWDTVILDRRDGRRMIVTPSPAWKDWHWIAGVSEAGVFWDDLNDPWKQAYGPDGKILTFPSASGGRFLPDDRVKCADPDHLCLRSTASNKFLYLYDIKRRRMALRCLHAVGGAGMVFMHGRRYAIVDDAQVAVHEHNRSLGTFTSPAATWGLSAYPAPSAGWFWGDDGTIWRRERDRIAVLRWRSGKPRIVRLPIRVLPDGRFRLIKNDGFKVFDAYRYLPAAPWAAVWGDGRLVACTETVRTIPSVVASLLDRARDVMKIEREIPREARRLTLYRNGKRIGLFAVQLKPFPPRRPYAPIPSLGPSPRTMVSLAPIYYAEHLAFSKDGRRLSWVVETGRGRLQVYAFRVK